METIEIKNSLKGLVSIHWDDGNYFSMLCKFGQLDLIKSNLKFNKKHRHQGLKRAIISGHLDVVKFLVDNKAKYKRALEFAVKNGRHEITLFLVEKGYKVQYDRNAALKSAIRENHLEMVAFLLEKGANIRTQNNKCLELAIKQNNIEMVKLLISKGSRVDINSLDIAIRYKDLNIIKLLININNKIVSKIYLSIADDNLEIIKLLIDNGADIHHGNCPVLINAAQNGYFEIVKYVVEKVAIAPMSTALQYAARNGHFEIVKYLVENGADVNSDASTSFKLACEFGYFEIVQFLTKHDVNIHANDDNALKYAAGYGHLQIVKFLIERNAKINPYNDNAPIKWAVNNNRLEVVKFLVSKGADIKNVDILLCAIMNSNFEIVKFLISKGADVKHLNVLPKAIRKDNLEIFNFIIKHGASMDDSEIFKRAAKHNSKVIVEMLIKKGVDIHVDDEYALKSACQSGYSKLVKILVENGADIHINNNACLIYAIESHCFDIVKFLIEKGANIHTYDEYALTTACHNGYFESVKFLINKGADIHILNEHCLKLAVKTGHLQVVKYLLYKGADIKTITDKIMNKIRRDKNKVRLVRYLTNKLRPFKLWKKVRKSIIPNLPKTRWQKIDNCEEIKAVINEAGLFAHRKNGTAYSPYLLKLQLAMQMTLLHSSPMITYNHIDCNNLNLPIYDELIYTPEHELIKDKYNNWYHITDLVDESGCWKIYDNPYTNESWNKTLNMTKQQLTTLRKNYKCDKLKEIHEFVTEVDIHFNAVRTIMIELDKSTSSNHLDIISTIDPYMLLEFFKKEVVSLEYFRYYTNEECQTMKDLRDMELFHKFLVITRTIMTDVNLSSYIEMFLENK